MFKTITTAAILSFGLAISSVSAAHAAGCSVILGGGSSINYPASAFQTVPYDFPFYVDNSTIEGGVSVLVYVSEAALAELTQYAQEGWEVDCWLR
jgi:hypothetical protein